MSNFTIGGYAGYYHDGKTAKIRRCTATIEGKTLRVRGRELEAEVSWPIAEIRLVDEAWHEDEAFQLRHGSDDNARLELADRSILKLLIQKDAKLKKDTQTFGPSVIATIVLACVLATLWFGLPYVATGVAKLAPRGWEEQLGETVATSAIRTFAFGEGEIRACVAEDGVNALADLVTLIDQNDGADYQYRLRVVDSDVVNAFAAPGGYIVIFRGILDEFKNQDELAAVLAHEIGHVTNQHSLAGIIKALGIAAIASIVTGDVTGSTVGIAIESVLNAQNSQAAEKQADIDGIAYLNNAGVTSTGLGTFFGRLHEENESGMGGLEFLSSHPASDERSEYSKSVSKTTKSAMSDEAWQAVQNICDETELIENFEWPEWMLKLKERVPDFDFDTHSHSEHS